MTTGDSKLQHQKKFPDGPVFYLQKSIIGFDQYAPQEEAWDSVTSPRKINMLGTISTSLVSILEWGVGITKGRESARERVRSSSTFRRLLVVLFLVSILDKLGVSDLLIF